MLDCACIAGIVALRHFRKPEVEVEGDEVIVVRSPTMNIARGTQTLVALAGNQSPRPARDPPHTDLLNLRALLVPVANIVHNGSTHQHNTLRLFLDAQDLRAPRSYTI